MTDPEFSPPPPPFSDGVTEFRSDAVDRYSSFYNQSAFARNLGLLSDAEMNILRSRRVAIPGLGGVGGIHLITLARTGIGKFNLADLEDFEAANLNRQAGASVSSLGRKKLDVMVEEALDINPTLEIRKFPSGVTAENMDAFLDGVDVVVDGLDAFLVKLRRRFFNRARERGIPVVTAGPMGFSSALLVFTPEGMGFDEYFDIHDGMPESEMMVAFMTGLSPRLPHIRYMDKSKINLSEHRGPSLALACHLCSGMAATEVIRLLTDRGGVKAAPHYFTFDPYARVYHRGCLWRGNGTPWRRLIRRVALWQLGREEKRQEDRLKMAPTSPSSLAQPAAPAAQGSVSQEAVESILKSALRAPSGDNCQPWTFRWDSHRLTVFHSMSRAEHSLNYDNLSSLYSLGALLESIRISASGHGYEVEIPWVEPLYDDQSPWAHVTFSPRTSSADPLFPGLELRHTDRRMLERKTMSPAFWEELSKEVEGFKGIRLTRVESPPDRLVNLWVKADEKVLLEKGGLLPTLKWIRFTRPAAQTADDGMPWPALAEPALLKPVLRLALKVPSLVPLLSALGGKIPYQHHLKMKLMRTSYFLCFAAETTDQETMVRVGRAAFRAWVRLNMEGWAVAPFSTISLTTLMSHRPLFENVFGLDTRGLLENLEGFTSSCFGLRKMEYPAWIFRIGGPPPGLPSRTHRRSPTDVLLI